MMPRAYIALVKGSKMLLHNGIQVKRKHTVEDILGEGAFGEVYRVRHEILGVRAMKIFKHATMTREELLESMREPILLSQLNHPNIIGVFDADTFTRSDLSECQEDWGGIDARREYGYYTMEYVPTNLEAYWKSFRNRLMPISEVVGIILQICEGLAVAHEKNPPILHRDIKPQNILIARAADSVRACITDFGLAKQVNPMTMAASAAGTPCFKPPEALSQASDSRASDVWAVGVTFYLLLTDQLPFEPDLESPTQISHDSPLVKPSERNCEVDKNLDEIVLTCLQKSPHDRYKTARYLLEALRAWVPEPQTSSDKDVLGSLPVSEKHAIGKDKSEVSGENLEQRLNEAFDLARSGRDMARAAGLLEEIIRDRPDLKERLSRCAELWRMGVYTPFVGPTAKEILSQS